MVHSRSPHPGGRLRASFQAPAPLSFFFDLLSLKQCDGEEERARLRYVPVSVRGTYCAGRVHYISTRIRGGAGSLPTDPEMPWDGPASDHLEKATRGTSQGCCRTHRSTHSLRPTGASHARGFFPSQHVSIRKGTGPLPTFPGKVPRLAEASSQHVNQAPALIAALRNDACPLCSQLPVPETHGQSSLR